jgi:glycosyltransferase involved in cell wall biosynthesis
MRLAIVFPSGHLFNTPCVPNLAEVLAHSAGDVAVYGLKNSAAPAGTFDERVMLRQFPINENRARERITFILVSFICWLGFRFLRDRPHFVIACGIRGLFVVGTLSYVLRIKFAYNSLEIYPAARFDGAFGRLFKTIERRLNRRAEFTVTQDEARASLLCKENDLREAVVLTFPNAPLARQVRSVSSEAQLQLRARLNIPSDVRLLLYAGSLSDPWGGVDKIIAVASQLPQGWALVLQSRMSDGTTVDDRMQELVRMGCLVLSRNPLSVDDYACLVACSSIGLAWYDSDDENIRLVGLSSGKIAQYWAHRKPIIVNRIPLYEEVLPRYQAGLLVESADEIPIVVEQIWHSYQRYSDGASLAYSELFDVEAAGRRIARAVGMAEGS